MLLPQALLAVTLTVPTPVPIVIVAETVVPPAVTAHPVPVTDHVYDVAPGTAVMLNILPVELAHIVTGKVIGPGAGGSASEVVKEMIFE